MKKLFLLTVISLGIFALAGCGKTDEKFVKVDELVNQVLPDKDGWMGKEVAVTGFVKVISGADDKGGYTMTLGKDKEVIAEGGNYVNCTVQGGMPKDEVVLKTVEVKGKIKRVSSFSRNVALEPCEIKKVEK